MADTASLTITIAAPHDRCWDIATDFEKYPDWAKDVKSAVVLARDAQGRATEVE
ncbi:MAG: SRPBCC family protein, partial [Actinomycetota bacterium]